MKCPVYLIILATFCLVINTYSLAQEPPEDSNEKRDEPEIEDNGETADKEEKKEDPLPPEFDEEPVVENGPKELFIGGLFDGLTTDQEVVFEMVTEFINNDNSILPNFQLKPIIERVPPDNEYLVSETICSFLSKGVVGIFGPSTSTSIAYAQSVCENMEIPYIVMSNSLRATRGGVHLNLFPWVPKLQQAYIDIIKHLGWKEFTILYENTENMERIDEILKVYDSTGHTVTIRQLDLNINNNFRPVLLRLRKSQDRHIIIDCSVDILYDVLKQAQEVGLIIQDYHYLITTLDAHTIDLEEFRYGKANITMMRLINPNDEDVIAATTVWQSMEEKNGRVLNESLTREKVIVDAALIHDAVYIFAMALDSLEENFEAKALSCYEDSSWTYGSTIINFMKNTQFKGLSGNIRFDHQGFRSDIQLELLEITTMGVMPIGIWNSTEGIKIQRQSYPSDDEDEIPDDLSREHFIVLISKTEPYGMLKNSPKLLEGNDRFEGFCVDLIKELSNMQGFNYTFQIENDYGSYNPDTGEWTGMVRKIMTGEAHLALTDLTITSQKQEVVDFSSPFMTLGISILFQKPKKAPPEPFSFMAPFSENVWKCVGGCFIGVSALLFILGRISPYEWTNPFPCVEEPTVLYNQFTFKNAMWLAVGAILQQGSDIAPIALSTRLVAGFWFFFTLIMVSSYTANLAAFLTVEDPITKIKSVEDLPKQTAIAYGAKKGGSTARFFKEQQHETYQQIYRFMESSPTGYPASNDIGVDLVENTEYAFFMESSSIEYITQRHCNLQQVGNLLDDKGYGIAMKKDSWYRNKISLGILQLQESGKLTRLYDMWWKEKGGGGACTDDDSGGAAEELGFRNVSGVFFVTFGLTILSFLLAICDLTITTYRRSRKRKISFVEALTLEFKFFARFSEMTKKIDHDDDDDDSGGSRKSLSKHDKNENDFEGKFGELLSPEVITKF